MAKKKAKAQPQAAGGAGQGQGAAIAVAPAPQKPRYEYRDGFTSVVPAQVAGERIAELQDLNGGTVTPRRVVDDARPEEAVLHPHFEWRDAIAADRFRVEVQARSIITSIRVQEYDEATNREVRRPENVHVNRENFGSCYVRVAEAFADEDMTEQVLQEAKQAYLALMKRYEHLKQLAHFHAALRQHLLDG